MAPSDTLRTLLHRLFTEPELRRAFVASPEAAIPVLSLGTEERRALHRLRRRLAVTGGIAQEQASPFSWP